MMHFPLIGAMQALLIVHAKHTHTRHREPIRSLYWRSKARSPHWASVAAVSPGHMSGLGALERSACSRRIGSVLNGHAVRAVAPATTILEPRGERYNLI
jgi:hypothetical protein